MSEMASKQLPPFALYVCVNSRDQISPGGHGDYFPSCTNTTAPETSSLVTEPTAQQGVAFTAADVNESVLPSASESECAALNADI